MYGSGKDSSLLTWMDRFFTAIHVLSLNERREKRMQIPTRIRIGATGGSTRHQRFQVLKILNGKKTKSLAWSRVKGFGKMQSLCLSFLHTVPLLLSLSLFDSHTALSCSNRIFSSCFSSNHRWTNFCFRLHTHTHKLTLLHIYTHSFTHAILQHTTLCPESAIDSVARKSDSNDAERGTTDREKDMEYNDLIRYFISNIQDIDDMLGPEPSPLSPRKYECRRRSSADSTISTITTATENNNLSSISSDSTVEEVPFTVVKVHDSAAKRAEVCCWPFPLFSLSSLLSLSALFSPASHHNIPLLSPASLFPASSLSLLQVTSWGMRSGRLNWPFGNETYLFSLLLSFTLPSSHRPNHHHPRHDSPGARVRRGNRLQCSPHPS